MPTIGREILSRKYNLYLPSGGRKIGLSFDNGAKELPIHFGIEDPETPQIEYPQLLDTSLKFLTYGDGNYNGSTGVGFPGDYRTAPVKSVSFGSAPRSYLSIYNTRCLIDGTMSTGGGVTPSRLWILPMSVYSNGSWNCPWNGLTWYDFKYNRSSVFTMSWRCKCDVSTRKAISYLGPQLGIQTDNNAPMSAFTIDSYSQKIYVNKSSDLATLTAHGTGTLGEDGRVAVAFSRSTSYYMSIVSDGSALHFYIDGNRIASMTDAATPDDFKIFYISTGYVGDVTGSLRVTEIAVYDIDKSTDSHEHIPVPTVWIGPRMYTNV